MRNVLLLILYVYHCKSDTCSTRLTNYVHIRHVHTKALQTRAGVTNGAPIVNNLLKTCLFQSVPYSAARCSLKCHTHQDCLAYEVGKVDNCELCLRNVGAGRNASNVDLDELVYIGMDMLEDFIDGRLCDHFVRWLNEPLMLIK